MTLGEFLRVVRRRWRVGVAVAVLGIIAATVIAILMPPSYEAKVDVFFTSSDPTANVSDRVAGYAPLVTNDFVTSSVVTQLGLDETPLQFSRHITVTSQPNSAVLSASVQLSDPAQASAAANGVANSFIQLFGRLEVPPAPNVPAAVTAKLVQPAGPPAAATWPSVLTFVVGLAVALVLGIAAALLRNALDPLVRSRGELSALSAGPFLGEVSASRRARQEEGGVDAPTAASAAEFRRLRSVLRPAGDDHPPGAFTVTSAAADSGRTMVSVNLATALAQVRNTVLLIEADLRNPRISHHFGLDTRTGLTSVLSRSVPLAQAVRPCGGAGLRVLPVGPIGPGSEDLLGSPRMAELLAEVREEYDVVVLDTAPLLRDPNAVDLASGTDGVLLVVGAGATRKDDVREAVGLLDQVATPLLGTVLTVRARRRGGDERDGDEFRAPAPPGARAPEAPAPAPAPPAPPRSPTAISKPTDPARDTTPAREEARETDRGEIADPAGTTAEFSTRYRSLIPLRTPASGTPSPSARPEEAADSDPSPDDADDANERSRGDSGIPATENGSKA